MSTTVIKDYKRVQKHIFSYTDSKGKKAYKGRKMIKGVRHDIKAYKLATVRAWLKDLLKANS